MANNTCSIADCADAAIARGWCDKHYRRYRKHGDPLGSAAPRPVQSCAVATCEKRSRNNGFCPAHDRRFRLYGDPLASAPKRPRARPRTCSIDGCEALTGKVVGGARGWCNMHYTRWARWGDPMSLAPSVDRPPLCSVAGCLRPNKSLGFCKAHYSNLLRHGEPAPRKRGEVRDGRKICSTCGMDRAVADFGSRPGGLNSACRDCDRIRGQRQRRANPEAARQWAREYGRRNAEKRRDYARLRRALKLSGGQPVERIDTAAVMERDHWICGICENRILRSRRWPDRLSASMDHVIPLSLGGGHTYENIQAAHLGCNMAKGGGERYARAVAS